MVLFSFMAAITKEHLTNLDVSSLSLVLEINLSKFTEKNNVK